MAIPSWLNQSLLKQLLKGAKILDTVVEEAVPKGDHYFSTLLRVGVQYLNEDTPTTSSFIVKAFPEGVMKDFMVESGAMTREITMYEKVLPMLNEIGNRKFAPNCFRNSLNDVLILEDLRFNGFRMEDRIKQMDFDHCRFAIEALADFHGASIVLNTVRPDLIGAVGKEVLYVDKNDYMRAFIVNCFNVLGNEVKSWPESSKYSNKLLESGSKMWDNMITAIAPLDGDVLVLNHGDFWTNNMLFRHNPVGDVDEVEFIDFQFCRWASPAFDLQRFFYTSVNEMQRIPELITCYTNRINKFLTNRNNKIQISKTQMDCYLDRLQCYALISTVCLLPTCVQSRDKPLDYKEVTRDNYDGSFETSNPYVIACKDATFRRIVPKLLEHFHKLGIL